MKFKTIYILYFFIQTLHLIGQKNVLEKEIEKIITYDSDISYALTPGFIVGVVDGDSTYFISYGSHKNKWSRQINKDDVFEVGSISKTISATLIMEFVNDGKLKLSDKFNSFIAVEYQNPRLNKLTIDQLINYQTSFPRRPAMFGEKEDDAQNPYANYTKQDLLNYYRNYVPEKNAEFKYSHINYGLLELVVESVCNCTYNDAIDQFLFKPLVMNNSFIDLKEKKENVISPGVDRTSTLVNPWAFGSFAASEGVKTSALDLINFMQPFLANTGTSKDNFYPLLTKQEYKSFNDKLFFSNGWHGVKINKRINAMVSNGNTNGHSAFIGMVPETKTAVVVLSNSAYGTKDLGLMILRMINYNWKRKTQ